MTIGVTYGRLPALVGVPFAIEYPTIGRLLLLECLLI